MEARITGFADLVPYCLTFIEIVSDKVYAIRCLRRELPDNVQSKIQIYPCKHWPLVYPAVFFARYSGKKMAPCAVMQQGAMSVQRYLRSLVIPFVAEVRGQKSGK